MDEFLLFVVLFVVTFLVILCIILPVTFRRMFRPTAHPEFEEVPPDDERIPASAKGFFREVAADLELLGFTPAACLINPNTMPNTTGYIALFHNQAARDAAIAMAVSTDLPRQQPQQRYAVEFCTEFADGTEVNTNNNADAGSFGPIAGKQVCRMPAMADLGLLYRVHLGLVARRGDSAVKQLPAEGTHAAEFRESLLRDFRAQIDTGRLYLDAKGESFRLTIKGMVLVVSGALLSHTAIRRWLVRRRARALLEEFNLRVDYETVDYRRRAKQYARMAAETPFGLPRSAPDAPLLEGPAPEAEQPAFACPACGGLIVADQPPGTQVRCALCQQVVTVPSSETSPVARGIEPVFYAEGDDTPVRRGLAVAALVCGIVGLFPLWFPVNLIGLILGIVAARRASRQPEQYGGRGLAIGGICTGAVGLLMSLFLAAAVFGPFGLSEHASRRVCTRNAMRIGTAMRDYAQANNGAFPPDFETLIQDGSLDEMDFWCPNSDPDSTDLYECYQYVSGQTTADNADNVLVYEKPECHKGEGGTVLFLDGRVEFVEPYAHVEDLVSQTRRRITAGPDD